MPKVIGYFDVFSFVNTTIPTIETDLSVTVTVQAVDELINRMRPHEVTVSMDITSGTMNPDKLQAILVSVIQKAASFDPGSPIGADAISKAIETECHYLGWC